MKLLPLSHNATSVSVVTRFLSAGCGLLLLLALAGCDKAPPASPLQVKIGQAFPELKLLDQHEKPLRFKVAPNTVTLINVWATWCGACRHEMPSLQRLADILQGKNANAFQVIGISVDSDAMLMREYLIDKKIRFPVYRDPDMQAANKVIGIRAFPSTFIVDADGRIADIIEAWRYWDEPAVIDRLTQLANRAKLSSSK